MSLGLNDRKSELSLAALRAISAKAGVRFIESTRTFDNIGVDVRLNFWGKIDEVQIEEVDINIQIKATSRTPIIQNGYISYSIDVAQYDNLRNVQRQPILLIVFFLHENENFWLNCTADEIILRKSLYWVNLRGADKSENNSSQTIYIPAENLLTPEALLDIVKKIAFNQLSNYVNPQQS